MDDILLLSLALDVLISERESTDLVLKTEYHINVK